MSNKMYDNITGRSPIATDDLGYIGTGQKASQIISSGTTNYNELTNKPSINSVELSGNKTSGDLGLQPAIDSSHKLSADNVDDTSTTNKFATAEQLEQIETNKNNILLLEQKNGAKNYIHYAGTTETITTGGANITVTNNGDGTLTIDGTSGTSDIYVTITRQSIVPLNLSQGSYVLSGVDSTSSNVGIVITPFGSGTQVATLYPPQTSAIVNITTSGDYTCVVKVVANTTVNNATIKPMLVDKSVWDGGFTDFKRYAMSNAEITAWILSQS